MHAATLAHVSEFKPNHDEAAVPAYELPPIIDIGGVAAWPARRAELLELFKREIYGQAPGWRPNLSVTVAEREPDACGGIATRWQLQVSIDGAPGFDLLAFVPNHRDGPVAGFCGLNFRGNHACHPDPAIALARGWVPDDGIVGASGHEASSALRGSGALRWPIELICSRGYAVATVYCGDFDPDFHDEFVNGVHGLAAAAGYGHDPVAGWGAIGAWAWGLSRALDALDAVDGFDTTRVAAIGHSRLGKTALWAGAQDERFAAVISNNSGCLGAALSRRCFGETVGKITTTFPHWFCGNCAGYAKREDELPVDQHQLLALIAPRPLYVASATGDAWADPRGEWLSTLAADEVYQELDTIGLGGVTQQPEAGEPAGELVRYHLRPGPHGITAWDWWHYCDFADAHLGGDGPTAW